MITNNVAEIINRSDFEQFYEEVCIGEIEILDELITDLKHEGQLLVDTILSSLQSEDLPVLQRAAHTLKSSTKIFGGGLISQQSATIELQTDPSSPGDFGTVSNTVSDIQENFSNFLLHLDMVVDSKR